MAPSLPAPVPEEAAVLLVDSGFFSPPLLMPLPVPVPVPWPPPNENEGFAPVPRPVPAVIVPLLTVLGGAASETVDIDGAAVKVGPVPVEIKADEAAGTEEGIPPALDPDALTEGSGAVVPVELIPPPKEKPPELEGGLIAEADESPPVLDPNRLPVPAAGTPADPNPPVGATVDDGGALAWVVVLPPKADVPVPGPPLLAKFPVPKEKPPPPVDGAVAAGAVLPAVVDPNMVPGALGVPVVPNNREPGAVVVPEEAEDDWPAVCPTDPTPKLPPTG